MNEINDHAYTFSLFVPGTGDFGDQDVTMQVRLPPDYSALVTAFRAFSVVAGFGIETINEYIKDPDGD